MKAYALTDIGKVRSTNQDAYYLPAFGERFCVVADGMGGHLAGEVASATAIAECTRWLRWAQTPSEKAFAHAFAEANASVYAMSLTDSSMTGMGTTLTALWFSQNETFIAHVGDSRAYLLRNSALMQITRDHSLVAELLEEGRITYQESLVHPQRNYITRAVGTGKNVEPDVFRMDSLPGDTWLLCTDGLTNRVAPYELALILQKPISAEEKVSRAVQLALQRGGRDNITMMLVTDEEER